MNCLEFRRLCLSEPASRRSDYVAHRDACDDCARYAESVNELDSKIGKALRVPVPEDLANRIKLRQLMQDERVSRRVRPWQYALAASVFLAVTLGGILGYQVYANNRYVSYLSVAAVDHTRLEREGEHFVAQFADPGLQAARFKQVLAAFGGKVMDDGMPALGPIVDVQVCPMAGIPVPVVHLLIQGDTGLVTVYYVPGNKLTGPKLFTQGAYKGMLIPAGSGNLAIVGDPSEPLAQMADKLEHALVWQI